MAGFTPRDPDFADTVRESFERQGMMQAIGAELVLVQPGQCSVRVAYAESLTQQHGYFHGGIVAALADTAGGYAALSLCPPRTEVLSVEFKINFIAPARGVRIVAEGHVLRAGRTLIVTRAEVDCVGEDGHATTCAVLQQTLMTLPVV